MVTPDGTPNRRDQITAMKIYLAGPHGFSEAGRAFHESAIVREIARLGHTPLDPWAMHATAPALDAEIKAAAAMPYGAAKRDTWRKLNMRIGAKNRALIDACDMVFAVLDGADVDSGTAAEIGYACAKGKPILGYRGDFRVSADNEGSIINLQVEYFIRASGGDIIMAIKDLATALERIAAAA
jgi:nucleoside 2-deoxyribosyltransferase